MAESYTKLPTSYLLGSVPAVVDEGKSSTSYEAPEANMQTFPPANGGERGRGYQSVSGPTETFEQQPTGNWRGVFNIQSYTQYFDVDTDIVFNRLLSSFSPLSGDFSRKIEANPDLYGPIWITTTLVFVLAALGNCATFLMDKRTDSSTSWSFDVGYITTALWSIYGYAIVVPLGFYFMLKYMGSNASLIQFWCLWGYSLLIFIPVSCFLLIPLEVLRWIIIVVIGAASACFVASNLRSYVEQNDLFIVVAAAFLLQIALALFIKVWFFP
ncbi:hypothetical protein MLD38_024714 [Melastoma candidum]|uniref:Uncharacterized protein n=1 Tax=Melastoma candidum TaxID=119954 RepID=A0ACB9NW69_9MYRT|nr:hypothetical protein MLD38_024714 [Melastoma candidum]